MSGRAKTPDAQQLQGQLKELAREITASLSELEPARSKELLGDFVAELFLSAAEQSRREERRQRQAEGIAAAKARGVKFGRPSPALPENFPENYRAWRAGVLTLQQAADACGMPVSTFYGAAMRRERTADAV